MIMLLGALEPLERQNPLWGSAPLMTLEQVFELMDQGWLPLPRVGYDPVKVSRLLMEADFGQFVQLLRSSGIRIAPGESAASVLQKAVKAERENPGLLRRVFERFVFVPTEQNVKTFPFSLVYSADYWMRNFKKVYRRS